LIEFKSTNAAALSPFMQVVAPTTATDIIEYVRGVDSSAYRNRTVTAGDPPTSNVWKLGDIVSSTARIQGGTP